MKHGIVRIAVCLFCLFGLLNAQDQKSVAPTDPRQTTGFIQYPREMSYQGLLTNSGGVPAADGSYNLQFDICIPLSAEYPLGRRPMWA